CRSSMWGRPTSSASGIPGGVAREPPEPGPGARTSWEPSSERPERGDQQEEHREQDAGQRTAHPDEVDEAVPPGPVNDQARRLEGGRERYHRGAEGGHPADQDQQAPVDHPVGLLGGNRLRTPLTGRFPTQRCPVRPAAPTPPSSLVLIPMYYWLQRTEPAGASRVGPHPSRMGTPPPLILRTDPPPGRPAARYRRPVRTSLLRPPPWRGCCATGASSRRGRGSAASASR